MTKAVNDEVEARLRGMAHLHRIPHAGLTRGELLTIMQSRFPDLCYRFYGVVYQIGPNIPPVGFIDGMPYFVINGAPAPFNSVKYIRTIIPHGTIVREFCEETFCLYECTIGNAGVYIRTGQFEILLLTPISIEPQSWTPVTDFTVFPSTLVVNSSTTNRLIVQSSEKNTIAFTCPSSSGFVTHIETTDFINFYINGDIPVYPTIC